MASSDRKGVEHDRGGRLLRSEQQAPTGVPGSEHDRPPGNPRHVGLQRRADRRVVIDDQQRLRLHGVVG